MNNGLNVYSEIGKLKTVLLHRPYLELENLVPDILERLLFDDIPYLDVALEEHDAFAKILRDNGVEVLYLEDLVADSITDAKVREQFITDFVDDLNAYGKKKDLLLKYYSDIKDNKQLVLKMMAGVRKGEISGYKGSFFDVFDPDYPFAVDPMPNLYFTRDPFAIIGNGVSLNHMRTVTRNRETLFGKYVFEHNPRFKGKEVPMWYKRNDTTSIEGGDELILSKELLAVGISERTDAESVQKLALSLFDANTSFKTVLAFNIPKKRAFMHLDTVFTMIDRDKFVIHPEIEGPLTTYAITKNGNNDISIKEETMDVDKTLAKYLNLDKVTLLKCGGDDLIAAAREQWNDGSNTLAIAPGEVIVYSRNTVTNKILQDAGIKAHIMPSAELSRGRGGPRCMSMPFYREDL